jgi:translation initiation factor IF-2
MNITALARKLKIPTTELREILPKIGYEEVGSKAIKINDKLALKIVKNWRRLMENYNKKLEYEQKQREKELELANSDKPEEIKSVILPNIVTVKQFADILDVSLKDIINELMRNGILASMNERLDYDTAAIIAEELGFETSLLEDDTVQKNINNDEKLSNIIAKHHEGEKTERPAIIVVMGHVDHGKTRLLDTIRKTNVIDTEAGGITQHIGAYQVEKNGHKLTFIDTPGHEAFTAMRSRGAKIADIAILIVAADDGVKPQTIEAIKIIKQSGIPMLVAINKVDKESANIDKVIQELAQYEVLSEKWGGDKIMCPISAKFGQGVDELLENITLMTEMESEKLVANPNTEAVGTVIESHIDKKIGPVATILVHSGTLHIGNHLMLNDQYFGKIKDMKDYNSKSIKEAGPSTPAQIIGFITAPAVGDIVEAKYNVDKKTLKSKVKKNTIQTGDNVLPSSIVSTHDGGNIKKFNIILKTDVLGSLEAIIESLAKIENKEVKANIINKGLGNITENDIWQAQAGKAVVIGFHVKTPISAKQIAEEQKVDIKQFKIIYDLTAYVEKEMEELLGDEIIHEDLGKAEVLAIFKKNKKNTILGARVTQGNILYTEDESISYKVNILRKGEFVTEGKLTSIQVGTESVTQVDVKQECGLSLHNVPELEIGDTIEFYRERTKKKTL